MSDLLTEMDREYLEALEREKRRMQSRHPMVHDPYRDNDLLTPNQKQALSRKLEIQWTHGIPMVVQPKPRRLIANREIRNPRAFRQGLIRSRTV